MSTAGLVPPGQYPPFATVTEDDHGAGIIIAAAMGIAFTSSVLVVRVFIRKYVNVGWQLDDTTLAIATVSATAYLALALALAPANPEYQDPLLDSVLSHTRSMRRRAWEVTQVDPAPASRSGTADRFGALLTESPWQLYYASNLLYLCAIDLSRISIVLFLRRLTAPSTYYIKWEIQAIVASIIELAIFAAPVWLVWQLQKNLKVKLEIVIWFGSRLLLRNRPPTPEATYICLIQAELSYSIVAATIPAARTLVTDLITYYNSGGMDSAASTHGSRGNTYQMRTLNSKSSGRRESEHGYLGNAQNQRDNGDADSQELIIRKEAAFQIGREEAY
ncbi:hypothetical protein LTS00_012495 [Friedmanniomyces endolithicus]|nr:hypothetical protein LTS00_012495 [Friedmanniomyces endolithicus]